MKKVRQTELKQTDGFGFQSPSERTKAILNWKHLRDGALAGITGRGGKIRRRRYKEDSCCSLVAQSRLNLLWPHGLLPPDLSVHGISQARILEWVAIFFSWGSSWPRDEICVSCIGRWILYRGASRTARGLKCSLSSHSTIIRVCVASDPGSNTGLLGK